jgi:hypothetical protein
MESVRSVVGVVALMKIYMLEFYVVLKKNFADQLKSAKLLKTDD